MFKSLLVKLFLIFQLHTFRYSRMQILPLKTFLCCMKLETGGMSLLEYFHHNLIIFVAGVTISAIHLILQFLALLFGVAFLTIYDCKDFENLIQVSENRICFFNRGKIENKILIKDFFSIFMLVQISSHLCCCWQYLQSHLLYYLIGALRQ